ncbi:MAG TPA: LysM peptidoglycan-binding domain-containing protein [Candidatus Cloacimonadota bacterium]|nr:LysM peptidoglycan-binding domain-containing protein [Candidatus Cloacimonadota bacterium]
MKKYLVFLLVTLLVVPAILSAKVVYLSETDYKKLNKKERLAYWDDLETELANLQQRKADAIAQKEQCAARYDELKQEEVAIDSEYQEVYDSILAMLNVSKDDVPVVLTRLEEFNQRIGNWEKLSDDELWKAKKSVRELINEYANYRETNESLVPDYRKEFSDLDNRIVNLEKSLDNAKPKYYEDTYTVVKGDWLSKIAGYSFIYNDISKWPIIYRANRDRIKDPNLIYPDQVIKIPRGLPNEWKVYKGECLWRIAGYPEVYNNAAKWPIIYRANKDQIKDPDLIYPNQVFTIPRD